MTLAEQRGVGMVRFQGIGIGTAFARAEMMTIHPAGRAYKLTGREKELSHVVETT